MLKTGQFYRQPGEPQPDAAGSREAATAA